MHYVTTVPLQAGLTIARWVHFFRDSAGRLERGRATYEITNKSGQELAPSDLRLVGATDTAASS